VTTWAFRVKFVLTGRVWWFARRSWPVGVWVKPLRRTNSTPLRCRLSSLAAGDWVQYISIASSFILFSTWDLYLLFPWVNLHVTVFDSLVDIDYNIQFWLQTVCDQRASDLVDPLVYRSQSSSSQAVPLSVERRWWCQLFKAALSSYIATPQCFTIRLVFLSYWLTPPLLEFHSTEWVIDWNSIPAVSPLPSCSLKYSLSIPIWCPWACVQFLFLHSLWLPYYSVYFWQII